MKTVQCSIKIQNNITEQTETKKGLRQGDAPACLLFNVVLETVMRDAGILNSGIIYNKSTQVLAYADNINIIGRYMSDTIEVFTKLERSAKEFGLQVNESKTKCIDKRSMPK
jgi:sorting nexin-29